MCCDYRSLSNSETSRFFGSVVFFMQVFLIQHQICQLSVRLVFIAQLLSISLCSEFFVHRTSLYMHSAFFSLYEIASACISDTVAYVTVNQKRFAKFK